MNHSVLANGIELIMLGAFFIVNSFRFDRPDFFNMIATHLDDPPFTVVLIIAGTICVMAAVFNRSGLLRWCLIGSTFIWMIYGCAFLIKNIELWGSAVSNLDCWFMFAVALRTILAAWAGDTR
ncbi:hypothetical protein ABC399_16095 [Lactiplantibacillus plantarum]|uniref:hypothetical protein n=1 Tax=Lactiplantibacillus plantarum TaxID=1590 RepID=UPI003965BBCB